VTDYFYDMDLVVDPLNPSNVVANGLVSIYDPADTAGVTLLALKDPSGLPLPNPLPSNANGFLPPRIATVPQTMWKSGGFTGYFNSYKGLRDESVAAVTAAQSAANDASAAAAQVVTTATVDGAGALVLTKASGATVNAGNVKGQKGDKGDKGDKGLDGSNVLPTETAVQEAVERAVGPAAAAAVANNPSVVSNAAALAQQSAGLLKATDAGVVQNRPLSQDNYLSAELSPSGKLLRGTRKDATVEIPGGTRVAGALTTSELQDQYIHAVLTPSRKVLYGIRKSGQFEVGGSLIGPTAPDPYDVIIVAGQSNATQIETLPVPPQDADSRIFKWSGASIVPVSNTATYLGSSFARSYLQNSPPGRRVLLVDAAVGSTGFTSTSLASPPTGYHTAAGGTWDRTLTSDPINLYSQMISKTQAALAAAGAGARLVAMLWVQGEEDTQVGSYLYNNPSGVQAAYAAKLDDLISTARTDLAVSTLPVLVGSMTPQFILEFATGSTLREKVHFAHMDTPRRTPSTAFIYGPEDMEHYNDTIHFSAQAYKVRGPMFVEALYRAKENVATANPLPPLNLRGTRSGDTVTVKWDAPPSRATAFTIEYSISGGAWTALSLVVPIALSATFTATAGQPVRLRGKTTNEVGTSHYTREVAI